MEIKYKPIKGFEGSYEISNSGIILGLKRCIATKLIGEFYKKQHILIPKMRGNYLKITLHRFGKGKQLSIHRLVAIAFVENPHNKEFVNHIDGDKLNNNFNNLEWVTASENIQHSYDTHLQISQKGSKHGGAKLTEIQVVNMRLKHKSGIKLSDLANEFNISTPTVCEIVNYKSWQHVA